MIGVAAVAVFVGVAIVGVQSRNPLTREILKQQKEILLSQAKIEGMLAVKLGAAGGTGGSDLSGLEDKLDGLAKALSGAGGGVQQARGSGTQQPKGSPRRQPQQDDTRVYDIPVGDSYVRGNPDAPATIVAFDNYQCPFCARFHPPIQQVLKAYPDKVNFMIKNFPLSFHQQAVPAAKAALAAGEQGKYHEMADALLANIQDLSDERFEREAGNLGLDVEKFMKDYKEKDAEYQNIIQKDMALGRQVGVRGTPTFYINGRKTNARDFNSWKAEIERILKK